MFSVLWKMRTTSVRILRYSFFTYSVYHDVRTFAIKLAIIGFLDVVTFPIAYLSLAALEPRVTFDFGVFILLGLVLSPDKLVLAGLAFVGAQTIYQGIELDNDAKLTV